MSGEKIDNRYMEFKLGEQVYALPLLRVKEVIQKPEVTTVPNSPAHMEGMINLRGQILAIFNIRKKLGAKAKEKSESVNDVVIVLEENGVNVGMIVDEVTKVIHATEQMIKSAPLRDNDPAKNYVSFVIQTESDLVLAINAADLLELDKHKLSEKAAA